MPIAVFLLPLAIIILSCQSPIETPPEVVRTVTVRVVDSSNTPMPSIPVEAYRLEEERNLLASKLTDRSGVALFPLRIPQNGGRYEFLVGSSLTGRISLTANLLCRDTILVVMLGGIRIPCGTALTDTISFIDICARSASGQTFPSIVQRQYCSTCDVPIRVNIPRTLPILQPSSEVQLSVFDSDGAEVTGDAFDLAPRGCFTIQLTYTPVQPGTLNADIPFSGSASTGETFDLTIGLTGNAVSCDQCLCGDSLTVIDVGSAVVTSSPDSAIYVSRVVNRNRSVCVREDNLIKDFTPGSGFTRTGSVLDVVQPNEGQPLQVRFAPDRAGSFSDTLVYETRYRENGLICRHYVILRGEGVQAMCCLDLRSTSPGYVRTTGTPRVDTLHLLARIYQSTEGQICFVNCGTGGVATVSQRFATPLQPGFSSSPQSLALRFGEPPRCFTVRFNADTSIVRPNGIGGPAVIRHETDLIISGCEPQRVHIVVDIDTLPISFSNCVYRWSQNAFNGYNFTPPENKGSFVFDANGDNLNMITDFTLMSIGAGSADVRVRGGWRLIRTGVDNQNDFMYNQIRTWPNFSTIKEGPFDPNQSLTMNLFDVYSIRVVRGSTVMYALIRIREISTDGQKEKICFDVLFPM